MRRLVVSQSNYIPWKGFFDLIRSADVFVVLDNVQFTTRDWRNRNIIKTARGERWLTIPVSQRGSQRKTIDEIEVAAAWAERHWRVIEASYKAAPAFCEVERVMRPLYEQANAMRRLSRINRLFLQAIAQRLGIVTHFLDARSLPNHPDRSLRLVGFCRALGANAYLTGPAARGYLDESAFAMAGITLQYADYSGYPPYPQLHGPFDHHVSIVDLIAHVGFDAALRYMRDVVPSATAALQAS